jgi:hypothetical protein
MRDDRRGQHRLPVLDALAAVEDGARAPQVYVLELSASSSKAPRRWPLMPRRCSI